METAQTLWQLYGAYFLFGFSFAVGEVISSTLFLYAIPDHLRGRVFSVISTLALAANPLGFLLAGGLGTLYGPRAGLWIGGGAIVVLGIIALFLPMVRSLDAQLSAKGELQIETPAGSNHENE